MAGSSSATWQLGVSRMRPPHNPFQPSKWTHLQDPSPSSAAVPVAPPPPAVHGIGLPDASHRPSPDPQPPSSPPQATWVRPLWERLPGGSCMRTTGLTSPTASW